MSKVRFSGFPTGSTVTLSALRGGVARGPLTVAAWKQPDLPPGNITFEVYSPHGAGQAYPYGLRGDRGGPNFEIADGDVIEMVQFTGLGLQIENVQGAATDDYRKLFFEIDYGERWDAQFLSGHPLPAGVGPRSADGATMGRYPMFVAGHVMRGTDMAGNEALTYDSTDAQGVPGQKDTTVTITVSDGINTATKTFTVRLSHWHRYYRDRAQTTYGVNSYRGTGAGFENEGRVGVIYVSRDGDFTGAPVGADIWHYTIPHGTLRIQGMFSIWTGEKGSNGEVLRDTGNAQNPGNPATQIIGGVACDASGTPIPPRNDFWWNPNGPFTAAIMFKGGETYFTDPSNSIGDGLFSSGVNALVGSWGGSRAIFSGENRQIWRPLDVPFFKTNSSNYRGTTFRDIEFRMSDYDVSDETYRDWWDILNYTGKTGTFTQNTETDFRSGMFPNGEMIRNAGSSVWSQVIADRDNGDGTGQLLVRHITSDADYWNSTTPATFTDGEQIVGDAGGATCTFVAAGSRQGRPRKTPPRFWVGAAVIVEAGPQTGPRGVVFDACIVKGARLAFQDPGSHFFISDTIARDWWDYGLLGQAWHLYQSAAVITQPGDYVGAIRDTGSSDAAGPKHGYNSVKEPFPHVPIPNNITHSPVRINNPTVWAVANSIYHTYGGHTNGTDITQPFLAGPRIDFGYPADVHRVQDTSGELYSFHYGCTYSGGSTSFGFWSPKPITGPPHWLVADMCWMRGAETSSHIIVAIGAPRCALKRCLIGFDSSIVLNEQTRFHQQNDPPHGLYRFGEFEGGREGDDTIANLPSPHPPTFFEDCTFRYGAGNAAPNTQLGWPTQQYGIDVPFTNCTFELLEPDGTPGVPALNPANVGTLPTGVT